METQNREKDAQQTAEREETAAQEQEATTLDAIWTKPDMRTQERIEKRVGKVLKANEFLRARMQAGKLTSESPDWLKTRRNLLRAMLS